MKERGMIFNSEMVQAILNGRKTQTRRIVNNSTANLLNLREQYPHKHYNIDCPFGQPGDRIWVRETFQGPLFDYEQMESYLEDNSKFEKPEFCLYAADGGPRPEYQDADDNLRHGWRPSIHMPRWASRITLEITAVRIERLNDISEIDANHEGMMFTDYGVGRFGQQRPGFSCKPTTHTDQCLPNARMAFANLWESIYGDYTWRTNPRVWVIEFKRVKGGAA